MADGTDILRITKNDRPELPPFKINPIDRAIREKNSKGSILLRDNRGRTQNAPRFVIRNPPYGFFVVKPREVPHLFGLDVNFRAGHPTQKIQHRLVDVPAPLDGIVMLGELVPFMNLNVGDAGLFKEFTARGLKRRLSGFRVTLGKGPVTASMLNQKIQNAAAVAPNRNNSE